MKQGKLRPWFRMLGMTILGSAIFALGFDLFLLPNQINIGGVSGIGMLLLELTGWGSVGLYSILINVPLFILGGKRLGRQFFFGSQRCVSQAPTAVDADSHSCDSDETDSEQRHC